MFREEMEILVNRYLKNRCTPEEAGIVLDWFTTPEGLQFLEAQLGRDVQLLQNENLFISPANVKSAEMFSNIISVIEDQDTPAIMVEPARLPEPALKIVRAVNRWLYPLRLAAAVLAGFSILLFTYTYLNGKLVSRSTGFGETARIILPDSSTVTLNGNSRIEYAKHWNTTETRRVKLEGEAFFSVRHKYNSQKFIVQTADTIQVEVLGTEFNISGRKRQTQVVLVSGKIRLEMDRMRQPATSVIMKPGESVEIVSADKSSLHKESVDPAVITSWTGNKLLFDNTSVRDICERLKDTYGYRISVSDPSIMNQRISGSVPNQNIDVVLQGLEAIMSVTFKKTTD